MAKFEQSEIKVIKLGEKITFENKEQQMEQKKQL